MRLEFLQSKRLKQLLFLFIIIINHQYVVFQLFQAEMFSRQQILHSIISDGQRMLEQGQVDDR